MRCYLEKPFTKIGLVEWFKVKALSSNPSTSKKKKQKKPVPPFQMNYNQINESLFPRCHQSQMGTYTFSC
jgi:hypothetical protein